MPTDDLSEGSSYWFGRKQMSHDTSTTFSRLAAPPPTLPRSMVWVLAACLLALAVLPWAIPALLIRIVTP
jgi:hypothetical protein